VLEQCADPEADAGVITRFAHMSRHARYIVENATRLTSFQFMVRAAGILNDVFDLRRSILIHGPGGVGKSTVANAIWDCAMERDISIAMLGPTQQAAEQMTCGETIHAFLGIFQTLEPGGCAPPHPARYLH